MSRTKSIFILSHDQKTTRLIRAFDGAMSSHYSRLQVGTIQGRVRTIPALVHPDATDQDMWRVVNLAGPSGTCFDSVAVLGALDDNQAAQWAMEEFGQYANAHVVQPVSCGNAKGVQYVLDHAVTHEPRMIRSDMLRSASDRVTSEAVLWDSLTLMSHLGTSSGLMRDLSSHDWDGELLDAMTLTDLAKLATDDAEVLNFDALIVQYNKLDTLINRLTAAMAKSTVGDLKVTNVTQSKPFKKNGVAQVAVLFELSDGQTMTILLHNPDSTPAKIAPTDNLTSWKWLLNKRDVSAVVQPKQGENVQMPVLAARMLKIATQNSARFKRTQGKRLEVEQTITDTQTRIQEKQGQLQALNNEIQALQGQIDEGLKAKPVADESVSSQLKNGKAEEWHTDVPTEGLPELKEEKGPYYRVGNIVIRIADDAVKAITKAQKLSNVGMYAYYMPSIPNTGRHGIVRLFPDDQTPGGSWKLLDPRVFYAGMVSDDQIRARLIELLSRAPVIAHGEQGDTGNGAVSGGDPANQGEPTDAQKIKMVDKAYRFASATDEFKIFAADSQIQNQNADDLTSLSVKAGYDPLSTAVAMDKAAKKQGFKIKWQIFTEPGMDDGLMARVYKENEEVGRISMGSDGKAMVYVGASGDTRVTTPSGIRAMFSDDDAPYMIDWLALHLARERDMNYLKSIVNGTDSPLADESRFWHVLNIVEQYNKPLVDEAYAVAMRIYDKFEKQSESVKSAGEASQPKQDDQNERADIQGATNSRRDPEQVSYFNPYMEGDIVSIGGQDWTVKQDTTGWYLTNNGNWRGAHPTIRDIKGMNGLISAILQASRASQPQQESQESPSAKPVAQAPAISPEEQALNKELERQAFMKSVNKIVKSKKSDEEKIRLLMENFKVSEGNARELLKPDFAGRIGFPDYELTSVNNKIKRLREKVDFARKHEEMAANGMDDMTISGVDIKMDKEENRLRLYFPKKPSSSVISELRSNGFVWSPTNQAWQRQLNENSLNAAKRVISLYADETGESDDTKDAFEVPNNPTPAPMPEPKPMSNPDRDYLQSVIDGKEDLSDGEAVEAELERIGENLTPELEAMFEKAVDAYAAYQVQQASKIA